MGRITGDSIFPANFEPRKAVPFDARTVVDSGSDLISLNTWNTGDGNAYTYKGMIVSVINDNSNNGVYQLTNDNYDTESNWKVISSDSSLLITFNQFTSSVDLDYITNNGSITDNEIEVGGLNINPTSSFTGDILLIKSESFDAVKVDNDGVFILGEFDTKPDVQNGSLIFCSGDLWLGISGSS